MPTVTFPVEIPIIMTMVTIPYLLLIGLVVWLTSSALEARLILLGLLTAIAAVAYGSLLGAVSVQVQQGAVQIGSPGSSLAGILMKIGVILVLAGVAVMLGARWNNPATYTQGDTLHAGHN